MSADLVAANLTLSLSRGLFGVPPEDGRSERKDRDRKEPASKQGGR